MIASAWEVVISSSAGYWGSDPSSPGTIVRAIRNGDIGTSGYLSEAAGTNRSFSDTQIAKSRVHSQDILITSSGNYGRVAFVAREPETLTCATNFVRILRADATKTTPRYLYHALRSPAFEEVANQLARGATIKNLSIKSALQAHQIEFPPLEHQRRITSILDDADSIRAKRHTLLTYLAELERSTYEEKFNGSDWSHSLLGECASDMTIGLVRPGHATGNDLGYKYMKMDGITSAGRLDRSKFTSTDASPAESTRYSAQDGDLLLNTRNSRELVGKTAVFRGESALFNNNLMRIRFNSRLLPDYVHGYLWSSPGRAALTRIKSGTTNVFAIYAKDLAKMPIPVPPIAVQQEFSTSLAAIRAERDRVARTLETDDELFAALQHRAFRGQL